MLSVQRIARNAALIGAVCSLCLATEARSSESSRAARVLSKRGLVLQDNAWMLREEIRLREILVALPELEKNFHRTRQNILELGRLYVERVGQLARLQIECESLAQTMKSPNLAATQRGQLSQRREQALIAARQMVAVLGNATDPASHFGVRMAVIQANDARNGLALAILQALRIGSTLPGLYKTLRVDEEIVSALAALPRQVLGPRRDYREDLAKVSRLEKQVFADEVSAYANGGRNFVSALVNDVIPATFALAGSGNGGSRDGGSGNAGTGERGSGNESWIPQSLLQRAGIKVAADASRRMVELPNRGMVELPVVKLEAVRFGRHVLRDVEVVVLPPECEELGAQLSPRAFSGYRTEFSAERLAFSLMPIDAVERKPRGSSR